MKKIFIIFLLLIPVCNAEIILTEIMYDPVESDNYNEYLEIFNYNHLPVNLTNFTICGSKLKPGYVKNSDGKVYLNNSLQINPYSFAIITDGGSGTEVYNTIEINISVLALHTETSSICGTLSNSGKTIIINGSNITYEVIAKEGESLNLYNYSWIASQPTPGNKYIPLENVSNNTEEVEEQDISIEIYSERVLESGDKSNYYLFLNSTIDTEVEVTYWIEDLFGTYIREKRETDIETGENKSRSFTPPEIYGSEAYLIIAKIDEEDSNEENNKDEFLIGIKGEEEKEQEQEEINETVINEPTLEILELPYQIKQGEDLETSIKIFNNESNNKNFTIYSYVFFSHQLASEGGWTANKQTIEMQPNEERVLHLSNKIKEDAEPVIWNFRVKCLSEEETEVTEEIRILEKEKTSELTKTETTVRENKVIYESDKKDTVTYSKYILSIVIVLISIIIFIESKNDNFFKR